MNFIDQARRLFPAAQITSTGRWALCTVKDGQVVSVYLLDEEWRAREALKGLSNGKVVDLTMPTCPVPKITRELGYE